MRGKNIHFQHGGFNITHFFGELQRAKYFDSILARLSIEDLEKITMQFEDQIKDIVIGEKYDCWRHKVFLYGSCKEYVLEARQYYVRKLGNIC